MMLVSTALGQRHLPICLSSSVFSLPAEKVNWRRTATFHTFTKIGYKSYKVIVDSESCINIISSRLCENLGLEIISHLYLFKVSWIDSTTLKVKRRCLVQLVSINIKTRFGVM